jgi:hypothetical protein
VRRWELGAVVMAEFSVVAMMRESPDVVRRFVDYYRALGASEVFVYFNGPPADLPPVPGATRTDLDAAFWEKRPGVLQTLETIEDRMGVCYRDCLARCRSPWLLIVDADEFVFSDRPLPELLDMLPEEAESISFPTAEAVWGPGDDLDQPFGSTHFRTKWTSEWRWRLLRRAVYGAVSDLMRNGIIGHVAGKQMVRVGAAFDEVRGHGSRRNGQSVTVPAVSYGKAFASTWLGHFDAISFSRWERKWRDRIDKEVIAGRLSRPRQAQMQMIAQAFERGDARALFRQYYGLGRGQFAAISALGYGFRREDLFDAPEAVPSALEPARAAG